MAAEPQDIDPKVLGEHTYRALVEAAPDIVIVFDATGRVRFVNAAVAGVLGYRPDEIVGRQLQDFFHPEDLPKALERVAAAQQDPSAVARATVYRLRHRDGSYRHLEALSLNRADDRDIEGIYVIARDVTRRVQEESARLAAAERRRLVAEVARIGIWEWNLKTNELVADEAVRALARQHPDQSWSGPEEFLQRILPSDRASLEAGMQAATLGQGVCRQVARMPLPDGSLRWLYIYAQRLPSQDRPGPWVVGLVMDVTDQKRAEQQALRHGESLELASWGADLGAWTWYPTEDRALIDERSIRLLGLSGNHLERPTGECNSNVHPDDLPALLQLENELLAGQRERFDYSYRVVRDGQWHWLLDRGRVTERDADGRVIRVSGVTLDIDETKQRESDLNEQRLRLGLALKASQLGLWDFDLDSGEVYVDRRYTEITGLAAATTLRDRLAFNERVHEEDRSRFIAAVDACFEGRSDTVRFEGRLLHTDGRLIWVSIDGFVAGRKADGTVGRLVGTIADDTERRRVEQMTRAGEFVAASGSYEFDVGADRFYWSEGTYRLFEFPDDFIPVRGSTRDLLLPSSRELLLGAFRAARERGEEFDVEGEAHTARGRRIWVRMIGRVETFRGRPVRVYGIVQDITERKRLEAALLDASRREQQRLGRELHDGLGQQLTGISMLLQGMGQQVKATHPALAQPFSRLSALLSSAIKTTRILARGLAPIGPGGDGLEGALKLLAEQSTAAYGIPVRLELELKRPLPLDEGAGSHLYRIAQEAIHNAMRHGKPSGVIVRLSSLPDRISLEVVDNGIGIAEPGSRGAGMGLQSMSYRAQTLHGSLEIRRRPEGGTSVLATLPAPEASG